MSLGTQDVRQALRYSRVLAYFAESIIQNSVAKNMTYSEIRSALKKHFSWRLDILRSRIEENGQLTQGQVEGFRTLRDLGPFYIYNDEELLSPIIDRFALTSKKRDKDYELLRKEYEKWNEAYCDKAIELNESYDTVDFEARQSRVIDVEFEETAEATIEQLIETFSDEQRRGGSWTDKTEKDYRAMFGLLVEIMGEGKLCGKITAKDCRAVKDILGKLPSRYRTRKETKGMSIPQVLKCDLEPKLHVTTINKHLATYSSLFRWAVNNSYLANNYFHGISIRQGRKKEASREAFTQDQLQTILYNLTHNHSLVRKDVHKWGALIALFTGARLNEVAQLKVEDVKQVGDIWCFDINDNGEKTLKTAASRRTVPVHPKLIELGLLDYRSRVETLGHERLLYKLTYHPANGYGRNLGRWFNDRFLKELNMKDEKLVFHSLRHAMVTALLQAGVEEPLVKAIVGHTQSGVTLQTYFERGFKIEQLRDVIMKFKVGEC
jgi:integrase